MGDKPIIRIAVPGDSAEEFMQNAAKQFRGDFFVAIEQPVGKFVRIEAPFLAGDVAVRGDAIAMPAVRNGRKGLVIRLVKLDPDSLGIPIPEASKQMAVEEPEESADGEFDPQPTMASPVSAAVAKSIRATAVASDRAQPAKLQAPAPAPAKPTPKPATEPTKLEDLDDETREAVNEFGAAATRASDVSADLAKHLAELEAKVPKTAPHAVRRETPQAGPPKQAPASATTATPAPAPAPDDDSALDRAFADPEADDQKSAALKPDLDARAKAEKQDDVDQPAVITAAKPASEPEEAEAKPEAAEVEQPAPKDKEKGIDTAELDKSKPKPKPPPPSRLSFLMFCLLIAMAGAFGVAVLRGWL